MRMTTRQEEERLLHKLDGKVKRAIFDYGLIEDGDRILVGLSGGKDSLALLELLGRRSRIFRPRFELVVLHVGMKNIPYQPDLDYLRERAARFDLPLLYRETAFDPSTDRRKTPCFLCSWMRRKMLFEVAKEEACNKIALGHHQDDILETLLMNLLHQGAFGTMPPRLRMDKFAMEIIRPLCLVEERDLKRLAEFQAFHPQLKNCPYETASARTAMKGLLAQLEQLAPDARHSLWGSMTNIQSDYLPIKVQ